jgi:hypothetical protein
MEKRTEFRLRFKDRYKDWEMLLRTTEPETEENIRKEILNHCRLYKASEEDFSPVDILDDVCDEHGWEWEDGDYRDIVFTEKQWFGCCR